MCELLSLKPIVLNEYRYQNLAHTHKHTKPAQFYMNKKHSFFFAYDNFCFMWCKQIYWCIHIVGAKCIEIAGTIDAKSASHKWKSQEQWAQVGHARAHFTYVYMNLWKTDRENAAALWMAPSDCCSLFLKGNEPCTQQCC